MNDLKHFFSLNEIAIHEMSGMPRDNAYNSFLYQQLMAKYGSKYVPSGKAWPKGISNQEKMEDVREWHHKAVAQDIYPSKEPTPRTLVSALEWPFALGSGQKSPNAAHNMRGLAVEVGFATQEQMDDLAAREGQKASGLEPAMPKMSSTVRTVDPKAKLPGAPPPKAPTSTHTPSADDEDFFSGS